MKEKEGEIKCVLCPIVFQNINNNEEESFVIDERIASFVQLESYWIDSPICEKHFNKLYQKIENLKQFCSNENVNNISDKNENNNIIIINNIEEETKRINKQISNKKIRFFITSSRHKNNHLFDSNNKNNENDHENALPIFDNIYDKNCDQIEEGDKTNEENNDKEIENLKENESDNQLANDQNKILKIKNKNKSKEQNENIIKNFEKKKNNSNKTFEGIMKDEITIKRIGTLRTCFPERNGTPRQGVLSPNSKAFLTITNPKNSHDSLDGLIGFSHLWLVFIFHLNTNQKVRPKIHPPRLKGTSIGLYATRTPHRPNPIGLTPAKIEKIVGSTIYLSGIDLVDGTPIVDIKPYIPYDLIDKDILKAPEWWWSNEQDVAPNQMPIPPLSVRFDQSVITFLDNNLKHLIFFDNVDQLLHAITRVKISTFFISNSYYQMN